MKKIIIYTVVLFGLIINKSLAQATNQKGEQVNQTFESKAKGIANKIEIITKEEKDALKIEVEEVNVQLEKGIITKEQAEQKKQELANARAKNIEDRVAVVQEELKTLVQQKVDGKIEEEYQPGSFSITFKKPKGKNKEYYKRNRDSIANVSERRTTSRFLFAIGLNNAITEGDNLKNSDFRIWGSRFYEWGFTYNSRIFKNDNLLHASYGLSLMYNDLCATDKRVFVENGDQTVLQDSPIDLKDVRFRNVYLAAPVHLEFDFTKPKVNKVGNKIFKTQQSFRLGLGGYAGVRIKSKQKIEYEIDDIKYQEKQKGDFNASDFIYGLSTYIGYENTTLYVKYDLNPIFKNNALDQNNVSLGVRFDLD